MSHQHCSIEVQQPGELYCLVDLTIFVALCF